MFKGTYFHSVDEKGRVAIPKQLRELIGKKGENDILIVTQGFEGCLFAYPTGIWNEIEEKASKLSILDSAARNFIRFFISPASECNLDKLGRIMIPTNLREYAGINKDIVISGAVEKIEIWAKERWEEYKKRFKEKEEEFIEEMKNIGL